MIAVAGINYQSAGYRQLSRVSSAVTGEAMPVRNLLGAVFVSTCNRIELYADLDLNCTTAAEKVLLKQLKLKKKPDGMYIHFEDDAILHLLKVAAGLDSAILGEDQVVSQLRKAFAEATSQKFTTSLLNKIFHKAFETAKLVRSLTDINKGNISVASIAAGLVQSFYGENAELSKQPILVIGCGETGSLLTQILVAKGYKDILVWNRTAAKAKAMSSQFGVTCLPAKALLAQYQKSAVVLVAVSTKEPIINYNVDQAAGDSRKLIIDLSLPFQVSDEVGNENCFVYNLEQVTAISKENSEKRQEAVDDAMQLVWSALHELKTWREQEWVGKTLQQWQLVLNQVQERELKTYLKNNPAADVASLAEFGRALTGNMLKQIAWMIRQQEKAGDESRQWSKILATVEPYEQLN